ncbi:magnesium transporter CorA family protein [Clostridium fallax]|uniref:Magnesium transporter n=1 Tax=Clostridium fallax TaxID=1533 RepID=A0A1M4U6P3_9CLOT|nr:magnesium transporter CorA family protein [Clostridium fallax]SHE52313.1 magnesium transporter [Clostridium fallax]SQB06103.1 divalent cation transporter [Clostridium fallax]
MIIYDITNNFKRVDRWELDSGQFWIILDEEELKDFNIIFSEESIKESRDFNQYPKIDYYKNYFFMTINELERKNNEIHSKEINIYLGMNFIIIVRKEKINIVKDLIEDIKNNRNSLILKSKKQVGVILYYILDRIIINNYNLISELEAYADKIEIEVLKSPKAKQINDLVRIRREAYKLRKLLNPLRYIGDSLIVNENNIINKEQIKLFKNINNKIEKLMIALDNLNQDIGMVREAYEAEIANKTNELMKAFTIITAIFLPLELITAIFSLSFEHMPLKGEQFAFYGLICFMIIIVIGMLMFFKRKKML